MKSIFHKSEIPLSQIFVIRHLQEKHFDPIWHAHSEYQLFVVLEGTGTRFIGDSIKAFKPGELVFTGPHLPHLWRSDEAYFGKKTTLKTAGIVIYFSEHFLGDHMMDKEEMMLLKKLFDRAARGIEFSGRTREQIISMMKELTTQQGLQSVIQLLSILATMAGTKEYDYISSKAYTPENTPGETDRMNIVYDYVLKNFRRKILLEELSELLFMTPTSFSRYFTTKNNKPFSKFVSEIRIKHACKLLTETDDPIAHICYECGFNTLSNFNKQFKEFMLKKPAEYKKAFLSI
ncbi:AraC family transcriptional regulator [Chitinophaga sp. SYP-B3965]|uniref:AraC family transcriptional regulator n=1 Tax=Chitinophaga sp. SYP-B3965 TaxID=2663120 RepID=UPI0012996CF8|nr:helix-turn-helix transcriptional regulator [Chitinophaga sp. SYP-B3965]